MSILRLSHVGICVADLGRARRFYRDGLGFRERSSLSVAGEPAATLLELPDVKLEAVYLERDGVRIELLHYAAPGTVGTAAARPMNQLGFTHLSLRVDDLDATLAALVPLGASVLDGTQVAIPATCAHAVFVTDPDGTRIELVESPGDPSALPGS